MKLLLAIISTFILIYDPALFGINISFLLLGLSLFVLILNMKMALRIIMQPQILSLVAFQTFTLMYLLIVIMVNNQSLTGLGTYLLILVRTIPISLFINILIKKKNRINTVLIAVVLIQSIISISSFFNRSLQSFFVNQLYLSGQSAIVFSLSQHRLFGYANNLTFSAPIASIYILTYLFYFNKNKQLIFFLAPFVIFSALINARVSIIVLIIGIIFYFLYYAFTNKGVNRILSSVIIIIFSLVFISSNSREISYIGSNNTLNWIVTGWNEIVRFLNGDLSSGYFEYLTSGRKTIIPEGFARIFGHGHRVISVSEYLNFNSDIGYINDIWLGGFTFIFIQISFIVKIVFSYITSPINRKDIKKYSFILTTICILIFVNIKGYIFSNNALISTIVLLLLNNSMKGLISIDFNNNSNL